MTEEQATAIKADYARTWEADQAKNAAEAEDRAVAIVALAEEQCLFEDGAVELDDMPGPRAPIVSEGDDNGAYVRAWVWVDFSGTPLDKEAEEDADDEG